VITWELAIDRYKVTEYWLEHLSFISNDKICNSKSRLVNERLFR